MAVVAFLHDSQRDGVSEHMDSQNNWHKLHLLSESVGQPLYALVYPPRVPPGPFPIGAGSLKYIKGQYSCQIVRDLLTYLNFFP